MLFDGLDQALFEFGIVHREYRLSSVEIDLQVRTFAGLESRSQPREPTLELFARHVLNINNIAYIGNQNIACPSIPALFAVLPQLREIAFAHPRRALRDWSAQFVTGQLFASWKVFPRRGNLFHGAWHFIAYLRFQT